MPESPINPLIVLGQRIRELGRRYGLELKDFVLQPSLDDQPTRTALAFTFEDDAGEQVVKRSIQRQTLDNMAKATGDAEMNERVTQTSDELRKRLDNTDDGIL